MNRSWRHSPVPLVMAREIRQRIRSRVFAISTLLLVIGVVGAGVANRVVSGDDEPERVDYAVVGDAPPDLDTAITATRELVDVDLRRTTVTPDTEAGIEAALRDGRVDVVLRVEGEGATRTGTVVSVDGTGDGIVTALDVAWRYASAHEAALDAGLTEDEAQAVLEPTPLGTATLDHDDGDDPVALFAGTIVAILLFMSISIFGGLVLTGVVEEKSTGVVEVLLGHVRPHQLLIGKVLGITVIALVQFTITLSAGVAGLIISGRTVPSDVWVALPSAVVWFLGAFVFYTTLFALAGSFVSRQEDAQGAAAPISAVMFVAYLTVFSLGADPSGTATRIVSLLPPFAPLLMPLRIATGSASVIEIALAIVLLLAGIYGMLRLTGAIYGRTLLHRGSRLTWRDAIRMARRRA
ncbi:MAG: ABC transporter permease [Acidimicrobiales bacterium]